MSPIQEIEGYSDLCFDVEVQLDRKQMTLESVLELERDSVIRLPRSAGENVDILIGGTLVCFGEIVIIEDTVGVRITDFREEE
jgi:flagellar motor switch protein FliN/FliY